MANNINENMGLGRPRGGAHCALRRRATRAQRARFRTDGTVLGGKPEGQAEAKEMMEGATGGALNYVTYI